MLGLDSWEPGMEDVFDDSLNPCKESDVTEEQEGSGEQSEEE